MPGSRDQRGRSFGEAARRALEEACRVGGVNGADATLIRLGENALYRLPGADSSMSPCRPCHFRWIVLPCTGTRTWRIL